MGFKYLGKGVKISRKASIYMPEFIEIGDYSRIDDFCIINSRVKIGRFVFIGAQSMVLGGKEYVILEDFVTLAYCVKVFSQSDDYSGNSLTNPTIPRKYKKEIFGEVRLEKHVIVGAGSIIFPGVVVREGTSVGAMSLVNKSTEPWSIYAGIPARKIKNREKKVLELEQEFLREIGEL